MTTEKSNQKELKNEQENTPLDLQKQLLEGVNTIKDFAKKEDVLSSVIIIGGKETNLANITGKPENIIRSLKSVFSGNMQAFIFLKQAIMEYSLEMEIQTAHDRMQASSPEELKEKIEKIEEKVEKVAGEEQKKTEEKPPEGSNLKVVQ